MWRSRPFGSVSMVLAELAHHRHTENGSGSVRHCDTSERNVRGRLHRRLAGRRFLNAHLWCRAAGRVRNAD